LPKEATGAFDMGLTLTTDLYKADTLPTGSCPRGMLVFD